MTILDSWTRTLVVCAWLREMAREAGHAAPLSKDHLRLWDAERALTAVGRMMLPMVDSEVA